ncbi:putative vancomycin B-type resistance protein VanW [Calothrix sp. NIES-4071]|nr:putative vancomycin B-type resistance protein VanW [Calothrix sp. NIES-4071]BAZ64137.1 putative vancomycin B-type resistance protein VanW [Calothrix sp. NIES-4105]
MKKIGKNLKTFIRRSFKYFSVLSRGYVFQYANIQDTIGASNYRHEWSQVTTIIKKRDGFANINENRLYNMRLAASKIDCLSLNPRQIFGFANTIGHPTVKNGFREGPTLVRGQLHSESGGGLCQISTTVFQALLMAGLEILERHNHSRDIHAENRFFTLGQDAAVADGYKDLIVRNQTQVPIIIRLEVSAKDSFVKASVWGIEPRPFQVKVESQILEKLAPSVASGMPGWKVQTIRNLRANDTANWETDYSHVDIYEPYVQHYSLTPNLT